MPEVACTTPHTPSRANQTSLCLALAACASAEPASAQITSIDLSRYQRVGRYDLPTPANTTALAGSLLSQEASAMTYNRDTGTLFLCGDGGTSVVQVSKTGQLPGAFTEKAVKSANAKERSSAVSQSPAGHECY